jgi:transposase
MRLETVACWIRRYRDKGPVGLRQEARPGRPARLSEDQVGETKIVLRQPPRDLGLAAGRWDGKTLAGWIERQYAIRLGAQQCRRLPRKLRDQQHGTSRGAGAR